MYSLTIWVTFSLQVILWICVPSMMAEHPPLLDTSSIISSEIPLLTSPIVSGDGAQQVRKLQYLLFPSPSLFPTASFILILEYLHMEYFYVALVINVFLRDWAEDGTSAEKRFFRSMKQKNCPLKECFHRNARLGSCQAVEPWPSLNLEATYLHYHMTLLRLISFAPC